jgi:glycerol-3-phosphate acyltransferase PlsY
MLGPFLIFASYLMGSLSAAIIVCRALGKGDPRSVGSGNPGATNVLRAFGKSAAALTLAGDVGKGVLPVVIGRYLNLPAETLAMAGGAAFIGHLFPIFFGFRGGKGVATFIGVLCGLDWRLGLAFVATWLLVAVVSRYSSLAALTATIVAPLAGIALHVPHAYVAVLGLTVIAIFWRHQDNIRRLLNGSEGKIGAKKA